MGQIHGYSLGSPTANVTANGELVVLGSTFLINEKDHMTGHIGTISVEHHGIHEGYHYFIENFQILASGVFINFGYVVPAGSVNPHLQWNICGTSQTEFRVYEGVTLSGGVALIPVNNNRQSTNTSKMIVSLNPTVSASGTLILASSRGRTSTNPIQADWGRDITRENELILKSGTSYLFAIKSVDDTNVIDYRGYWYEVTDGA